MPRKNIWTSAGSTKVNTTNVQAVSLPVELKTDALNKEGRPAFKTTPEELSLQALMTGSLANTFYANARENMAMFLEAFNAIDVKLLAEQVVFAREKGFTRTIPISATVVVSKKDPQLFKKIVHRVIKNPHDWRQFIDICRSKQIRNGIGRSPKREINSDLIKMKSFHAVKYPQDVLDMINIARPNEKLIPAIVNYVKGFREDKPHQEYEADKMIEAAKAIQNKELSEDTIVSIIENNKLPYEFVVGAVKVTPRIWEALLYSAPYRNLITNLNNFGRNGVFNNPRNLRYAIESIMTPDKIRNSMIFPFRFYIAWSMIGKRTEYTEVGENQYFFGESEAPYNGMNEIKNALQKALEISVDNIPEFTGSICIAPDISGSMSGNVIQNSDKSKLKCIDLVGLFTGIIMKKCRNSSKAMMVLPFNNDVDLSLARRLDSKETIFDIAKEFRADGGTSLSAPVTYLRRNSIKVDRIVAFTDEEEWVVSSFIDEFYLYKTTIAPECKAYLVKLIPSNHDAAPPNIKDINFVYGWNENVLRYVTGDIEEQMDEVRKIEL